MNYTTPLLFSFLFFFYPSPVGTTSPFPPAALPTNSGHLPVSSNSSLFYAFYEAQHPHSSSTPILVWLQGGPGCSSMVGNFFELGPWILGSSDSLQPNPNSWNRRFGVLFVDNPVGTGFSVAGSVEEIPADQNGVSDHMWIGLQAFLDSNLALRSRPLYLTGESYAGKYVPAVGSYILKRNLEVAKNRRIRLEGVAVGNGLTHPPAQVSTHAVTAYYIGLINGRQRKELEEMQKEAIGLAVAANWSAATDARNRVLNWLQNTTGLATLYNFIRKTPYETAKLAPFLNRDETKLALNVPKHFTWEECSETVSKILHADVMKSVKPMVQHLLSKSRVLLYQGQLDLRDGVVSTEAWIEELEWDGLEGFSRAERKVWKVDGEVGGYVQKWRSLTHVVVAGAGHFVPTDRGRSSQVMIEEWVMKNGVFGDCNGTQVDSYHPRTSC